MLAGAEVCPRTTTPATGQSKRRRGPRRASGPSSAARKPWKLRSAGDGRPAGWVSFSEDLREVGHAGRASCSTTTRRIIRRAGHRVGVERAAAREGLGVVEQGGAERGRLVEEGLDRVARARRREREEVRVPGAEGVVLELVEARDEEPGELDTEHD